MHLLNRLPIFILVIGISIPGAAREYKDVDDLERKVVCVEKSDDLTVILAQPNNRYVIRHSHNLAGRAIHIGENSVLDFQGGRINNGTLSGDGCHIYGELSFDHVNFTNSFKIGYISDNYITTVDEENLVDLFSLLNDEEYQIIEITKHYVTSTTDKQSHNYFSLMSHSKLILNGTISIGTTSTNVSAYRVFLINEKDDVEICGDGGIIGDRDSKTFKGNNTYEYGVGIGIYNSTNISIHDISIEKMIGDGIYITATEQGRTENIHIFNTKLKYNRRQGISLIAGNNVLINNNYFGYTGGTQPEAAFDLEPNQAYQTSSNVYFCDNILEYNNDGIHIHDKKAPANNVIIDNNTAYSRSVNNSIEGGYMLYGGCNVVIANSGGSIKIKNQEMVNLVIYKNTGSVEVDSCTIHQSLGFINTDNCSGELILNDCVLDRSVDLKQTWYTNLIYTRKGSGHITNVELNRCKLSSPTGNLFNTICVEGNQISRFVFNDCVIDINGVLLCRANSTYSHCKIRCGRIKVSLPSTKDSLIMDGNIFYLKNNTQTKPTILFDRISSRSEDEYNTVLQNNVFLN